MDEEQKANEAFTLKLARLASKYPSLKITTALVRDGKDVLVIPPDDLAILDADMIDSN